MKYKNGETVKLKNDINDDFVIIKKGTKGKILNSCVIYTVVFNTNELVNVYDEEIEAI